MRKIMMKERKNKTKDKGLLMNDLKKNWCIIKLITFWSRRVQIILSINVQFNSGPILKKKNSSIFIFFLYIDI